MDGILNDYDFQCDVLKLMIEDASFFPSIANVADHNYFSDRNIMLLVGKFRDYYKKNGLTPSYNDFRLIIKSGNFSDADREGMFATLGSVKMKRATTYSPENIKSMAKEYFQEKESIKLANTILQYASEGKEFSKILKQMNKSLEKINSIVDEGNVLFSITGDTIMKSLTETNEETIPTYIPGFDKYIAGGLGKREIGLFVAPTGYGKTTFASVVAQNAAVNGYKVLQIYFEDKETDLIRKHIAKLLASNCGSLKNMSDDRADVLKTRVEDLYGYEEITSNLRMLKMKDAETTVEDIEAYLVKLSNIYDFRPDLIVLDYFGCLKHSTNPYKDKTDAETRCMKKLKELIYKYNCAMWLMQQTNRAGAGEEKLSDMSSIQGSYAATGSVSVWVNFWRTAEQKENFKGNLRFNKSRHSMPTEKLENIVFNNSTLQIDCSESDADREKDALDTIYA